ncbi:MAG: hypothetical protein ACI906_004573 [Candidatus Latescibacterota bacterium]|jgi:hypothetical protein
MSLLPFTAKRRPIKKDNPYYYIFNPLTLYGTKKTTPALGDGFSATTENLF